MNWLELLWLQKQNGVVLHLQTGQQGLGLIAGVSSILISMDRWAGASARSVAPDPGQYLRVMVVCPHDDRVFAGSVRQVRKTNKTNKIKEDNNEHAGSDRLR